MLDMSMVALEDSTALLTSDYRGVTVSSNSSIAFAQQLLNSQRVLEIEQKYNRSRYAKI